MADDALDASKINVNPGGKQPVMRDTMYRKDFLTLTDTAFRTDISLVLVTNSQQPTLDRNYSSKDGFQSKRHEGGIGGKGYKYSNAEG